MKQEILEKPQAESREKYTGSRALKDIVFFEVKKKEKKEKRLNYDPDKLREFIKRKMAS